MVWPPTPTSASSTQTPLTSLLPLQFFPSSACSPTSRQFDVSPQASLGFGVSGGSSSPTSSGTHYIRAAALPGPSGAASQSSRGLSLPSSSGGNAFGAGLDSSGLASTPGSPRFLPFARTSSPSAALLSKVLVGANGSPTNRAGGRVTPSTPLHLTTTSPTGDPFPLFATTSTTSDSADGGPFSNTQGNGEAPTGTVTPTLLLPLARRSYREPALLLSTSVSAADRRAWIERGESCADATPMSGIGAVASLSQCAIDITHPLLNTPRSAQGFSRPFSPTTGVGHAVSLLTGGGSSHPAFLVQQQNALHTLATAKGDEAATLLTNAASSGSAGDTSAKDLTQRGVTASNEESSSETFASENENCLQKAGSASPRHGLGGARSGSIETEPAGHVPTPLTRTTSGARSISSPASRRGLAASRAVGGRTPSGASVRRVPPPLLLDPSFLFHPAHGMGGGSCSRNAFLFDDVSGCGSLSGSLGAGGATASGSSVGDPSATFDSFSAPFSPSCFSPPSVFGIGSANAPFYSPTGSLSSPTSTTAVAVSAQRLLSQTVAGTSPASPLHLPLLSQRQQLLLHQGSHQRRNSFPSPTSRGGRGPATPTGTDPLFGVFSASTASQRENGDTPRTGRGTAFSSSHRTTGTDRTLPLVETPRCSLPPFPSLLEFDVTASGLSQAASLDARKEGRGNSVSGDSSLFSLHMFLPQSTSGPGQQTAQGKLPSGPPVPSLLLSAAFHPPQSGCAPDRPQAAADGDTVGVDLPSSGGMASSQASRGNETKPRETTTILEGQSAVREGLFKKEQTQMELGHAVPAQNASPFLSSFLHTPSFLSFPGWQDRNGNFASLMQEGAKHGDPGEDSRRPEALSAVAADPDGSKPPAPSTVASTAEEKVAETDGTSEGSSEGLLARPQDKSAQGGMFNSRTGDMLAENSPENGGDTNGYGVASTPLGTPSGTPSSLCLFGRDACEEEKQTPSSYASSEDRCLRVTSQSCKNKKLSPRSHASSHTSASQSAGGQPMSPTKGETEGSPSASKASGGKSGASGFFSAFEDAAFQQPSEEFIAYCVQKHQARWPTPQNLPGIQMEQQQRRWCASVYYRGCQHKRRFSMGRWGLLGAFYAAIEWRQSHCSRLNSLKGSRSPGNGEASGSGQRKRRRRSSSGSYSSRTSYPNALGERLSSGAPGGGGFAPDSTASGCPVSQTGSEGSEGTLDKHMGSGGSGGDSGNALTESVATIQENESTSAETSGAGGDAEGGMRHRKSSFVKAQDDVELPGFYQGGLGDGAAVGGEKQKTGTSDVCGLTQTGSSKASEDDNEAQAAVMGDGTGEEMRRFGDENARDRHQSFMGRLESTEGSGAAVGDRSAYAFFGGFQETSGDKGDSTLSGIAGDKDPLGEERRRRENEFDSRGPLLGMTNTSAESTGFGSFSQDTTAPGFGTSMMRDDRMDGNMSVHSSHSTSGTCPSFNSPQTVSQSVFQGTGSDSGSSSLPPPFLSWNDERGSGGKDGSAGVCPFNGSFLPGGQDSHFLDSRDIGTQDMPGGSLGSPQLHAPANHTFNPTAVSTPYGNTGTSAGIAGFPGTLSSASPCRQGASVVPGRVGVYGQQESPAPPGGNSLGSLSMGFMPPPQSAPFDMQQHLHSMHPSQMYGHMGHLGSGSVSGGIGQNGIRPPGVPGVSGVPPLSSSMPTFRGGVPHSRQLSMGQPPALSPSRPLPSASPLQLPVPHLYGSGGWMQGPGSHAMNPVPSGFMLGSSAPNQSSPLPTNGFSNFPPNVSSLADNSSDTHGLVSIPFGAPVPGGPTGTQSSRAKVNRKEGIGTGLPCSVTPDVKKASSSSCDKQTGSSGPSRSRRTKAQNSNGSALGSGAGVFPVSPYSPPVDQASASSFPSNTHRQNLQSSFSPSFRPASSSTSQPLPPGSTDGAGSTTVEWHEGFRRPFGTEGRQQLLRHLRQVYNADSGYWGERLRHANIAFSRIAYATVAELWKIAHFMDCFPIALAFSNRHSATAASVATEDGALGTAAGASGLPGSSGTAGAGRRSCGTKGGKGEKCKGSRRNNNPGNASAHNRSQHMKQGSSPAPNGSSLAPAYNGTMTMHGSEPGEDRGDTAGGNSQASVPFSEPSLREGDTSKPPFCVSAPESSATGRGNSATAVAPLEITGGTGNTEGRSWDGADDSLSGFISHPNALERRLTEGSEVSLPLETNAECEQQGHTDSAREARDVGTDLGVPVVPVAERETINTAFPGDQASSLRLDASSRDGSFLSEDQARKSVGDGWGQGGLQTLANDVPLAPQGLHTDTSTDDSMEEKDREFPVKKDGTHNETNGEYSTSTLAPGKRSTGAGGKRREEGARQPSLTTVSAQSFFGPDGDEEDYEDASGDQRAFALSRVRPGKRKREAKEKKVKEEGDIPVAPKRKEETREEVPLDGTDIVETGSHKGASEYAFVSGVHQTLAESR